MLRCLRHCAIRHADAASFSFSPLILRRCRFEMLMLLPLFRVRSAADAAWRFAMLMIRRFL